MLWWVSPYLQTLRIGRCPRYGNMLVENELRIPARTAFVLLEAPLNQLLSSVQISPKSPAPRPPNRTSSFPRSS